jgi:hypothetical protein
MAAPASVATQADPNTAALGQAARVAGLWHYPLNLRRGQTWYLDRDSGMFDIYQLEVSHNLLRARCYDYLTIEKTGIMVPTKIEIFTADTAVSEPRRIIEFNYHTLKSVGF